MISFTVQAAPFAIRPITPGELDTVLAVYRQCEDFLALGPDPTASMAMVLKDIEISQGEGGIFCGIYTAEGILIGVVDYMPRGFAGNPQHAYLSLLMLAAPFRGQGIGPAVVTAVEAEIQKDAQIQAIFLGAQVNHPQAVRFWQRQGYGIVDGPKRMPDQTTVFELRKDVTG